MDVYKSPVGQPKLKFKNIPFEFIPDPNNRWVRLADLVPWEELELLSGYRNHFGTTGNPALPFRVAFGALLVQARLRLTDEETVEQIRENPYIQHFLGFEGYRSEKRPFDPSMLVHFRKRLDAETLKILDLRIFERRREAEEAAEAAKREEDRAPSRIKTDSASPVVDSDEDTPPSGNPDTAGGSSAPLPKGALRKTPSPGKREPSASRAPESPEVSGSEPASEVATPEPCGTLILDATCAPADITYPTDLKLLAAARVATERLLDTVWSILKKPGENKPRTYRHIAARCATIACKQRNLRGKKLRSALKKQLSFLTRNLNSIDTLLYTTSLGENLLNSRERKMLETARAVHRQQKHMLDTRTHRADRRIVNFAQPHLRPIVRGKAGAKVEFGAKILVAVENGHTFVVRSSWENFNESTFFIEACEQYRERNGYWPAVVCADMIFRTRANLAWCKERGTRLSGPSLGRPPLDEGRLKERKRIEREDAAKRNEVEGKFGEGKRKYGLNRIRGKLPETSDSIIILQFIIMNLWRMLRDILSLFQESVEKVILFISGAILIHNLSTLTLAK